MEGGGGSVKSSEEKGAEKLMDEYLKSIGLHRKKIAKDGSCLFRAVAEQVMHCQSLHTKVRAECVDFLKENRGSYEAFIEGDFEDYLFKLRDPQQWVGEVEINALAVMYKRDFLIFQEPGKPAVNITDNDFKEKVRLCFLNGNHYDSVYPVSHIRDAALCQSILYELLYDGVFQAERASLGSGLRAGRSADVLSDDAMNACVSSDDSDADATESSWTENITNTTRQNNQRGRGRGRLLPERVRRSLNPTLFRNVEYDVWQKSKRAQQKLDYCIAAGMQFTVGDRCQVRLEAGGRSYSATIKEVSPNNGPVTVYLEELGTRKQVPLWSLRPPNEENSWSTVVNRDKRVNGHGEWEERGKGRGRGKNLSAAASSSSSSSSSLISPAPAPSSSGRVQKQHSWPPQATVEEQGGAKPVRKSLSSVDPPSGLTDRQRSQEEKKQLEIQLWDENSFPALATRGGMQTDGGRRRGGEKGPCPRTKTKSPVDDVGASSPGERPKSSTPPPPASTVMSTAMSTTMSTSPSLSARSAISDADNSAQTNPPLPPSATLFLTPALASAASPPTPPASSSSLPHKSSSSSLPPKSSSSSSLPPKSSSSSLPPPSSSLPPPTFIAPIAPSPAAAQGFLPHSSLSHSSLPHSPSPISFSSLIHQVREAPPPSVPNSLQNFGPSQTQIPPQKNQISVSQTRVSLTQEEIQMQGDAHQPQSHSEEASLPQSQVQVQTQVSHPQSQVQVSQSQTQVSHLQPQSQTQVSHLQPQSQTQVSHLHPQSQTPVSHLHPQSQVQYLSQSHASSPHPSLHPPITQNPTEAPFAPPHPSAPSHPHQSAPPHHQTIPGAVPLQQLSQLYQDPLYPGFPQGDLGDVAPTPPFSSCKSGTDLPQDLNILKFFFNLGIKAYSVPMCPPYIYLLPLQQAHTMRPSRSPSPLYHLPPPRQQEAYPVHPQYEQQAPPSEPPHPGQARYPFPQPPPHRMSSPSLPWQQLQMPPPRNAGYQVGYGNPGSSYRASPPLSQGYHPQGHPMYPQYPPEEIQVSQGPTEQRQPTNGDPMPGRGPTEGPAANVANANNIRTLMNPGFALKEGDGLTRTVLLVDQHFNNRPIMTLVSKPDIDDVSMTTRRSPLPADNNPSRGYRGYRKSYAQPGAPEPGRGPYTAEALSVGCGTEDDCGAGFKPPAMNYRGPRRNPRGPRGRGAPRRRHGGDVGTDSNFLQFSPSQRGRGRDREYYLSANEK